MSSNSARHLARLAARQSALALADSAEFDEVQQSCVEILADLLLRYVQEVGAASHHYAELAGRTDTNAIDVVRWRVGQDDEVASAVMELWLPPLAAAARRRQASVLFFRISLCAAPFLQALALNDMGTNLTQLRQFMQHSPVRRWPACCAARRLARPPPPCVSRPRILALSCSKLLSCSSAG